MKDYIEFKLNEVDYWISECTMPAEVGTFCWSNGLNEEGKISPTLLEAQQDAIDHESGRADHKEQETQDTLSSERYELEQRLNRIGGYP